MLVIRVTNVSFVIESFITYEKVIYNVIYEENFPTSKILVSFIFFNMANLLQIKLREVLQKTGRKNVIKILKNTCEIAGLTL